MEKIKINGDNWTALRLELSDQIMFNAIGNEKLNKQFPSIENLYHYTSLNGLISIIENQTIYCTNLDFLNDKKEFKHGVSLILSVIEKLKQENYEPNILNKVEQNLDRISKSERFVTCFSKNGDLLSQWRAYTNQGKGVAIGFDFRNFKYSINQTVFGRHIEYDENYQQQVIEELIRIIIEFFKSRKEIIDWEDFGFEWLVNTVIIEFLQVKISSYKSHSFQEEQEYRFEYEIDGTMIKKRDEEIFFRASDTLIIPYIKLKAKYKKFIEDKEKGKYDDYGEYPSFAIDKLPIKEIVIGPSLDFDSVKRGIEELLYKFEYKEVKIIKSEIPYRI
jgi:hypothetical protein